MLRRLFALLIFAGASLLGPAVSAQAPPPPVTIGMHSSHLPDPDGWLRSLRDREAESGYEFDAAWEFARLDGLNPLRNLTVGHLQDGRTLLWNLQACDGSCSTSTLRWTEVAAGSYDARLRTAFGQLASLQAQYPGQLIFSFNQEPTVNRNAHGGVAADFRAAWIHVRALARAEGFTVPMMLVDWDMARDGWWTEFYPGSAQVDIMGPDGSVGSDFDGKFGPVVNEVRAKAPGKPVWISSFWWSGGTTDANRIAVFKDAEAYAKVERSHPTAPLQGIVFWDSGSSGLGADGGPALAEWGRIASELRSVVQAPADATPFLSSSPDRASPVALDGATLKGSAYVFVPAASGIQSVKFSLDGAVVRTESIVPYDYAGTAGVGTANPLDTTTLSEGQHTFSTVVTMTGGATSSASATVTVDNVLSDQERIAELEAENAALKQQVTNLQAENTSLTDRVAVLEAIIAEARRLVAALVTVLA